MRQYAELLVINGKTGIKVKFLVQENGHLVKDVIRGGIKMDQFNRLKDMFVKSEADRLFMVRGFRIPLAKCYQDAEITLKRELNN